LTVNSPIQRVVTLLTNAGYRPRELPMTVAKMPFEFSAVLLGADRALDLIVLVDTLTEAESRIRQKIEGLSRALDLVASRRPLTVVLVGPPPRAAILEALGRVCRVLTVGTPTGKGADRFLSDALAVLLPLELPRADETVADPIGEVQKRLPASPDKEGLSDLLKAAPQGADAVQDALRMWVGEPLMEPETGQP
jgi:hypothetical protein